jgi:hypothetical protein
VAELQHPTPLAALAAEVSNRRLFAFDRGFECRTLARLQTVYAATLLQLENLQYAFDEGVPTILVQGQTVAVSLRLSEEATNEVYAALHTGLDNRLADLEQQILTAHLDVERGQRERAADLAGGPDYVAELGALCQPASAFKDNLTPAAEAGSHHG